MLVGMDQIQHKLMDQLGQHKLMCCRLHLNKLLNLLDQCKLNFRRYHRCSYLDLMGHCKLRQCMFDLMEY